MTETQLPCRLVWRPAVIIAAHPDDEILGLGTLLSSFRSLRAIVHVTDGAPRRGPDVANAGVNSWQEYAALRRREFVAAIQKAGIRAVHLICLGYPDQQASLNLTTLPGRLARVFQRFRPASVFTHPYEGGHPDHDACALSVRLACSVMDSRIRPEVFEFASYHASSTGSLQNERFLSRSRRVWSRRLDPEQQKMKSNLLSAYVSQRPVLAQFPLCYEPVRVAPRYDFRKPPHRGKLYYENFDWGMTGSRWRRLASQAMRTLAAV